MVKYFFFTIIGLYSVVIFPKMSVSMFGVSWKVAHPLVSPCVRRVVSWTSESRQGTSESRQGMLAKPVRQIFVFCWGAHHGLHNLERLALAKLVHMSAKQVHMSAKLTHVPFLLVATLTVSLAALLAAVIAATLAAEIAATLAAPCVLHRLDTCSDCHCCVIATVDWLQKCYAIANYPPNHQTAILHIRLLRWAANCRCPILLDMFCQSQQN